MPSDKTVTLKTLREIRAALDMEIQLFASRGTDPDDSTSWYTLADATAGLAGDLAKLAAILVRQGSRVRHEELMKDPT